MKEIVLAIDIMGGDFGPSATIEGVAIASEIYPHVKFKLFGNKKLAQEVFIVTSLDEKEKKDLIKKTNPFYSRKKGDY